jgi:hypothetical protein
VKEKYGEEAAKDVDLEEGDAFIYDGQTVQKDGGAARMGQYNEGLMVIAKRHFTFVSVVVWHKPRDELSEGELDRMELFFGNLPFIHVVMGRPRAQAHWGEVWAQPRAVRRRQR